MIKKTFKWIIVFTIIFIFFCILISTKDKGIGVNSIGDIIGFLTAIVATIGLFLQIRLSKQEQNSFRQQLISVLHHSAGITDALFSLENSINKDQDRLLRASIESVRKSSSQLQMGLIETRVGGKQLSDDLDQRYQDWAKLELDMKLLPMREFIKSRESVPNIDNSTDQ